MTGELEAENALGEGGEVGEQGLAAHRDEVEGAGKEEGDGGGQRAPEAGRHRLPAGSCAEPTTGSGRG